MCPSNPCRSKGLRFHHLPAGPLALPSKRLRPDETRAKRKKRTVLSVRNILPLVPPTRGHVRSKPNDLPIPKRWKNGCNRPARLTRSSKAGPIGYVRKKQMGVDISLVKPARMSAIQRPMGSPNPKHLFIASLKKSEKTRTTLIEHHPLLPADSCVRRHVFWRLLFRLALDTLV